MPVGPTSPEMPGEGIVPGKGEAPLRATGQFLRAFGKFLGKDQPLREQGAKVKTAAEALHGAKKNLDKLNEDRSATPAAKETQRREMVKAAKTIVTVDPSRAGALSPEEQRYVDAVTVAAAERVLATMPRTVTGGENPWRPGAGLERGERYLAQQPAVTVTRTSEGLRVLVTTGGGSVGPDGAVKFQDSMPFVREKRPEDTSEPKQATDEEKRKARVTIRQYDFVSGRTGTPDAGRMQMVTVAPGGRHTESVVDNGNDGFATVQRSVDNAQISHSSYYQQSGEVRVGGNSYQVRIISTGATATESDAREQAQRYLDNGGTATTETIDDGKGGTKTVQVITIFSGSDAEKTEVWPENPEGVRLAGITTKGQVTVESARTAAAREVAGAEAVRVFREQLNEPGFVSVQDMEGRIGDRDAALVAVAAVTGVDSQRTRDEVTDLLRQQKNAMLALPPEQAADRAFSTVVAALRARIVPPGRQLSRNEENALWAAAKVLTREGINTNYKPTDRDLEGKVQQIRQNDQGTQQQKGVDIAYLIGNTSLSPESKRWLIEQNTQNAAGRLDTDFARTLREGVREGRLTRDQVPAEYRELVDTGEVLPTSAGAAVTRLMTEAPHRDERADAYRARLTTMATNLGLGELVTAAVDRAMVLNGMDAVSQRGNLADMLTRAAEVGLRPEDVERFQEALNFTNTEGVTLQGIMALAARFEPSPTDLTSADGQAYRTRVTERVHVLGLSGEQEAVFVEMVMAMNGMDDAARRGRAAETLLTNYGASVDTARNMLPPAQYIRYLTLSGASAEDVMSAVSGYMSENPQDLGQLRELARDYQPLQQVVNGLIYGIFAREFAARQDESLEERRTRLTTRAGELASLSSNSEEVRTALLAMIPPAEKTVDERVNEMSAEERRRLSARLLAEDRSPVDDYLASIRRPSGGNNT